VEPEQPVEPAQAEPPAPPAVTDDESTADMLRSMLSRAVEDQLVDQHEIASLMSDMRSQLMRFGQEIADMRANRPRDDSSDAQINSVTVELREAVRFLSERIDGVTRMVAQRGEDLADIRGALTAVDAHVRSQAETIGLLSAGLQSLPSYGEQISVLADNLAIVHRQLVAIDVAVNAAATPSEERLAAIEASVTPLAATMSELAAAISSMQTQVEPLASDVTAIGGHVTGLVEGTADGAALDSRVRESVSVAVAATEQRLIAHIDEAVLALAQTLLKRRPVSIATPVAEPGAEPVSAEPANDEPAVAEPAPFVAEFEPVVTDEPLVADEPAITDEPVPMLADEPVMSDEPVPMLADEPAPLVADEPAPLVADEPAAPMDSSMSWMSEFAALDASTADASAEPGPEQVTEPPAVATDWAAPAAEGDDLAAAAASLDLDSPGFGEPGFDDAHFDDDAHDDADRQMLAAVDFLDAGPPAQADDAATEAAAYDPVYDASQEPTDTAVISVAPPVEASAWQQPVPEDATATEEPPAAAAAIEEPLVADVAPTESPDTGALISDPPAPEAPAETVEPQTDPGEDTATVPVPVPGDSAPAWPSPDQSPADGTVLPEVTEEAPEPKRRWFRSG
jgi:hypothetical protein